MKDVGDIDGAEEVAKKFGIRHIPEVERNEHGSPLLDGIFSKAQTTAHYEVLCYVNADIILISDFMRAVEQVAHRKSPFLMIGIRHSRWFLLQRLTKLLTRLKEIWSYLNGLVLKI